MAHPAASVKSIFSGKVNLDPPTDFDPSELDFEDDDSCSRFSNESLSSKNLKYLNYSNNLSANSSDFDDNDPARGSGLSTGPVSPALSRHSTTSCLSTTATKDGIEGKKLHRKGPNAYSNHLIANMAKKAEERRAMGEAASPTPTSTPTVVEQAPQSPTEESFAVPTSPLSPKLDATAADMDTSIFVSTPPSELPPSASETEDRYRAWDQSNVSFQTTDAQINGEQGKVDHSGDVPLSAKIELLNR